MSTSLGLLTNLALVSASWSPGLQISSYHLFSLTTPGPNFVQVFQGVEAKKGMDMQKIYWMKYL